MERLLKVAEAAELLNVHPLTVRRLNKRGELRARRDYLGHRVFDLQEVLRVKEKREQLVEIEPGGVHSQ